MSQPPQGRPPLPDSGPWHWNGTSWVPNVQFRPINPSPELPPQVPHGFEGPANLQPILNSAVIGFTTDGRPWFARPSLQQQFSPGGTDIRAMTAAISEAIRAASPIAAANPSSSSSTSRPTAATPESLLIRCAEKMLNAVDLDLPAVDPSVARVLTFDGTPRSASTNRSTYTADYAVHQLVGRSGFPIFMTMPQLNRAAEHPTGEVSTVFACFRDSDKKNVTTTLLSNTSPPSTWSL